ncbi:MAG: SusD/RagB family nutrient-binding outer membrane lipoprotein [Chitinophagaceae bacterium]|nr:SusD/RagB family nutrient-binding outer membrane lipoprotein [Chitinophagaceae bacterium]
MNYKFLKISAVILMGVSMTSCKKYLDINDDPNNAKVGDPKSLFSFAAASFADNRAGGDMYIPMALGGQSISSGGSAPDGTSWGSGGEDQYVFSPLTYANIWSQYFTSVASNLRQAINLSESSVPRNENGAAACKVILAETFYELTTTYGDIPFSEALDLNNLAPKFDAQKDVLEGCLGLLDAAIAQFDEESDYNFGSYDLFYYNADNQFDDIGKWIKAAKSIKLRILMTMVDKDPSKATEIAGMIATGGFLESPEDNMKVAFENVAGKRNPKFELKDKYLPPGLDFFYASPYVLDFMKSKNDPRIPYFFRLSPGASDYEAIQPGDDATKKTSKLASTLHSPAQPEYVFTYQELLFYKAEIYARGLSLDGVNLVKANASYKEAVKESAIFFGVPTSDAAAFADSLPVINNASDLIKQINYQHWIDKFDRGVDAFIQWRRSGPAGSETPDLTLPFGAQSGGLFRRYEYPQSAELASNPNAPALIHYTEKVWFDL